MALNTLKCNRLTPLRFKGLKFVDKGRYVCDWLNFGRDVFRCHG